MSNNHILVLEIKYENYSVNKFKNNSYTNSFACNIKIFLKFEILSLEGDRFFGSTKNLMHPMSLNFVYPLLKLCAVKLWSDICRFQIKKNESNNSLLMFFECRLFWTFLIVTYNYFTNFWFEINLIIRPSGFWTTPKELLPSLEMISILKINLTLNAQKFSCD